jgi:hypothetical protein
LRRESVECPLFIDKIPCLAVRIGETGGSEQGLGLDRPGICLLYLEIPDYSWTKFCSGIKLEIRADNKRFPDSEVSLNHSCVTRLDRLDPPSLFEEGIFCLAWIMGTKAYSGRSTGISEKSH